MTVNMEVLWHVLRLYDVGGKLSDGIDIMYINSLTCVSIKHKQIIPLAN